MALAYLQTRRDLAKELSGRSTIRRHRARSARLLLVAFLAGSGLCGGVRFAWAEPRLPPTRANVRYGSDPSNILDLWLAKSARPTPLLVYIHGGGWYTGNKELIVPDVARLQVDLLGFMLDRGVSVAAIDYRLTTFAPLPAPVLDAARAVQWLRAHAGEFNLDRARVAAWGSSAGACTSLWLAYHRDLADPASPDPVLRESTRLSAALGFSAQVSIDPRVLVDWVGPRVLEHPFLRTIGVESPERLASDAVEWDARWRECSPINHVAPGAPPVMLVYRTLGPVPAQSPGAAIHHALFGLKLKERAEAAGATCVLWIRDRPEKLELQPNEFLLRHLGAAVH
jgi:acetyl esterase/lipase